MSTLGKPRFSPSAWEDKKDAGCYPYAMNWHHRNEWLLIGDIIGKRMEGYHTDEELIATLKEELEFLGYSVKDSTFDEEKSNHTKIYLMRAYFSGRYHLFREDQDGWSHKYPGSLPINLDFFGEILWNPDEIDKKEYYGWFFLIGKKAGP